MSYLDEEERFFCHHAKNVIKPGEKMTFVFSFKSSITGIFTAEWEIKCEPFTLNKLPIIKLKGHAITEDPNIEWRENVDILLASRHLLKGIREIVDDIVEAVETPPTPPPDLSDPLVC